MLLVAIDKSKSWFGLTNTTSNEKRSKGRDNEEDEKAEKFFQAPQYAHIQIGQMLLTDELIEIRRQQPPNEEREKTLVTIDSLFGVVEEWKRALQPKTTDNEWVIAGGREDREREKEEEKAFSRLNDWRFDIVLLPDGSQGAVVISDKL